MKIKLKVPKDNELIYYNREKINTIKKEVRRIRKINSKDKQRRFKISLLYWNL